MAFRGVHSVGFVCIPTLTKAESVGPAPQTEAELKRPLSHDR